MDLVAASLRWSIVLVLVTAVVGKVRNAVAWQEFQSMLLALRVPRPWLTATSVALVGAEAAVAVIAAWPATATVGLAGAAMLFLVLTGGVWFAVRHAVTASCRCFGGGGGQLRRRHIVRNAGLAVVAMGAAALCAVVPAPPLNLASLALCLVAAAVATAVVVRFDDLAALFFDESSTSRRAD